ncbi:Huntingtin [Aphelenchoides besseyi]|nr:Huntingtin [Aphelenchoides besseyi]
MSSALEKRLKKAIIVLENAEATSPRKQKESCSEACLTIRKLLVDEEYWPRSFTSRAINCVFNCLNTDDSSLRILADQCLNAIFRKFILRSHPSRCLAALLNEISRKGSARGFTVAIGMLLPALEKCREQRLGVYAMHFMHSLREALCRPEQIVHSSIEMWSGKIISFFQYDYDKSHISYATSLLNQCIENLSLTGMASRASTVVLADIARYVPGMLTTTCDRLLDLLVNAEESTQKSRIVGVLNTYRRIWPFINDNIENHMLHLMMTKILCCLRANSSEIQTAVLELLDCIVENTPFSVIDFKPFQFINETISFDSYKSKVELSPKSVNGLADLDETVVSRFNSCTSLFGSANSSRADDSEPLETESLDDDYETVGNSEYDAEFIRENNSFCEPVDPLYRNRMSIDDSFDEKSPDSNPTEDSFVNPIEGLICDQLPTSFGSPSDDFCFYSSTWVCRRFLLTGQSGEIRSNLEVRTSLKILALKYLASVAAIYDRLIDVTVFSKNSKQGISELYQYFAYDDDALCMAVYSLFAVLERTSLRTGRFLSTTNDILKAANPRRLKELFQIFAENVEFVLHNEHLFTSACDAAIGSVACDYFLLKIARGQFFSVIQWSKLNPALRVAYQRTCFTILCRQFFDSDHRVVEASINLLPTAIKNAEFGSFFSNIFYVDWPQSLYAPSFPTFPQVFGLHSDYSFHGDEADIAVEKSLSEVFGILANEFLYNSSDRLDGYIAALFTLSQSFSPVAFGTSWSVFQRQNRNPQSFLTMLTEIADSSITNLKSLSQVLRLLGSIFAGVVENAFIRNANRAEGNQNIMYIEGQQNLEKIVALYLRVLNLYFTIIKESSTKTTTVGSSLLMGVNWASPLNGAEESRSYSISHLVGTGIRPFRSSSFLNSTTLRLLEPSIRGSFLNFMTSLKSDAELRLLEPLNAALDGFAAILEVLSRELLNSFIDELFLYIRCITNLSIGPTTNLISQMLKILFDQNAAHINSNAIVSLKIMHSVFPTDPLEMYIGREMNNYSVYSAFIDRIEHMNLHQLRHLGWMAKSGMSTRTNTTDDHVLEIKTRLEQFEKSVTQLLNVYPNTNPIARSSILNLMSILVLNDVRYDKLDPNNRVWNAVLNSIKHPALKNSFQLSHLFAFICIVSRTIAGPFDEILQLLNGCVQITTSRNVDDVLDAVYCVLVESINQYSTVSPKLLGFLSISANVLFKYNPAKTIQLWTVILHWSRQLNNESKWQELSSMFYDEVLLFLEQSDQNNYSTLMCWDVAHSLTVALKTCNSALFRPIDQMVRCFVDTSEQNLFFCIPFAMMLFCRSEHDTILLRMSNIMESPLEKIGACLAKAVLTAVLSITNMHDKEQDEYMEKGISFFIIILLHVFRAEVVQSDKFSRAVSHHFKDHLLKSEKFDQFLTSLSRIANLYPKIYGIWSALAYHIDFFKGSEVTMFSSTLPFYANQLNGLLFLQRVNDHRLLISEELEKLIGSVPDDFLVRLLKIGRGKQLELLAKRLNPTQRRSIIEKTQQFMKSNGVISLLNPLLSFMHFDEQSTSMQELCDDFNPIERYEQTLSWILDDKLEKRKEHTLTDRKLLKEANHLQICEFFLAVTKPTDDFMSITNTITILDNTQIKKLIDQMNPSKITPFISALFKSLEKMIRDAANRAHLFGQVPDYETVIRVCRCLAEILDNSKTLRTVDYQAILCGFHSIPRRLSDFDSIRLKSFDKIFNNGFISDLIEANVLGTTVGCDFYKALQELFYRSNIKDYFANDYLSIEHLCQFLRLLIENLEQSVPKASRFKMNRNHWKVDLKSECTTSERLKEEILESFNLIQRAAHLLFLFARSDSKFHRTVHRTLCSIIRVPVFSKMFVVPRHALTRDWSLNMVGKNDKLHVPLINIHMLNDPEILNDFVRRVLLLGWTQKSQFEDWWMSLFGVLCSTPTGDELNAEDVQKISEQIQASSVAVDALTNMIVQSLLYPIPGDTVNSEYLIKPRQTRDSYLFLQSLNGKHASIARNSIEFEFEPQLTFVRNIERNEFNQRFYSVGQTSVYYLWSISGELEATSTNPTTPDMSGMKSSVSNYLLSASTDLDTSSSLKSLLENFFHWCRQGFHKLPLPLLTATLKSFAILSDFFNDASYYSSVYVELKALFNRHEYDEHAANGLIIYTLLKCVSIADLETIDPSCNKSEVCQATECFVKTGLESSSTSVTFLTLHGILYLLQSVNVEEYNSILLSAFDFILTEVYRLNSAMDLLNVGDFESVQYHELILVVAFRLVEQIVPPETENANKFIEFLRNLFIDPRIPTWQRRLISNGIQTLVIHNVSYCETFREVAVELFDTYQLRPLHFPYALSVYCTCIYRLAQHKDRLTADQIASFESDFQKQLNIMAFYTVNKYTSNFLPAIARLIYTVLDKTKVINLLLNIVILGAKNGNLVMSSYDRNIYYLFYFVLRFMVSEQQRTTIELTKTIILPQLNLLTPSQFSTFLCTIILCSLSSANESHLLVHLLLGQDLDVNFVRFCYDRSKSIFLSMCKSLRISVNSAEIPVFAL